jgi:hypothetical protein
MIEERMFAHGFVKVITTWEGKQFSSLRIYVREKIGADWPLEAKLRIETTEEAHDLMKVIIKAEGLEQIIAGAAISRAAGGAG